MALWPLRLLQVTSWPARQQIRKTLYTLLENTSNGTEADIYGDISVAQLRGFRGDAHTRIRIQKASCEHFSLFVFIETSTPRMQSLAQKRATCAARAARPARRSAVVVQAKKTADGPRVAIVGITGAVGQEFLTVRFCSLARANCRAQPSHCAKLIVNIVAGYQGAQLPLQRHQDAGFRQVGTRTTVLGQATCYAHTCRIRRRQCSVTLLLEFIRNAHGACPYRLYFQADPYRRHSAHCSRCRAPAVCVQC